MLQQLLLLLLMRAATERVDIVLHLPGSRFGALHAAVTWLQGGFNTAALASVVVGALPCMPGLLASVGFAGDPGTLFKVIYDCAWFVGVGVSSVVYCCLMAGRNAGPAGASATTASESG